MKERHEIKPSQAIKNTSAHLSNLSGIVTEIEHALAIDDCYTDQRTLQTIQRLDFVRQSLADIACGLSLLSSRVNRTGQHDIQTRTFEELKLQSSKDLFLCKTPDQKTSQAPGKIDIF